MMINNLEDIISRQLNRRLSPSEMKELTEWYNASDANRKLYRDCCLKLKSQSIERDMPLFEKDKARALNRVKSRISRRRRSLRIIHTLKYAAAAIAILMMGVGIANFMHPGGANGGDVMITVPDGSKSQITLPDGSTVWLNSGSTMSYSADFGEKTRTLRLDGEGVFDVAKNPDKPFEVYAGDTHIRVLGTRFVMKAYSTDEREMVTLLSGSLMVASGSANDSILIEPGQQAVIEKGHRNIKLRQVESGNYALWTEPREEYLSAIESIDDPKLPSMRIPPLTLRNTLFFDEEPLSQIVRDLSRAYNVTILIENEEIASTVYYGDFRNEENLYQILDVITSVGDMTYDTIDNKIIIKRTNQQTDNCL